MQRSRIVGFILAVRDNETKWEVSDSYTSLLNAIAFYVLGVFMIIYFLSTGWSEFDDSEGQKTIVATYLAIAIAGIIYSNYNLSKPYNSNYTLATLAANLVGFFGCLYYLAAIEDGDMSPISVNSEKEQVIEVKENSVFIGTGKDTAYYKVGDKTFIDKQNLDSIK